MYELRAKGTNELIGWSAFPDEIRRMKTRTIYDDVYIIFNPHWED